MDYHDYVRCWTLFDALCAALGADSIVYELNSFMSVDEMESFNDYVCSQYDLTWDSAAGCVVVCNEFE